jgi:hypothetical protein
MNAGSDNASPDTIARAQPSERKGSGRDVECFIVSDVFMTIFPVASARSSVRARIMFLIPRIWVAPAGVLKVAGALQNAG